MYSLNIIPTRQKLPLGTRSWRLRTYNTAAAKSLYYNVARGFIIDSKTSNRRSQSSSGYSGCLRVVMLLSPLRLNISIIKSSQKIWPRKIWFQINSIYYVYFAKRFTESRNSTHRTEIVLRQSNFLDTRTVASVFCSCYSYHWRGAGINAIKSTTVVLMLLTNYRQTCLQFCDRDNVVKPRSELRPR